MKQNNIRYLNEFPSAFAGRQTERNFNHQEQYFHEFLIKKINYERQEVKNPQEIYT